MSTKAEEVGEPSIANDWERRQKHAAFYQETLNAVQQTAMAFFTSSALLVTLGIAMMNLSGLRQGQEWFAIYSGVFGWVLVIFGIRAQFGPAAERIDAAYREEHAKLFPATSLYRLESFLLPATDRRSRVSRWFGTDRSRQPSD